MWWYVLIAIAELYIKKENKMQLNVEVMEMVRLDLEKKGATVTFIAEVTNRTVDWKIRAEWEREFPWIVYAIEVEPESEKK